MYWRSDSKIPIYVGKIHAAVSTPPYVAGTNIDGVRVCRADVYIVVIPELPYVEGGRTAVCPHAAAVGRHFEPSPWVVAGENVENLTVRLGDRHFHHLRFDRRSVDPCPSRSAVDGFEHTARGIGEIYKAKCSKKRSRLGSGDGQGPCPFPTVYWSTRRRHHSTGRIRHR